MASRSVSASSSQRFSEWVQGHDDSWLFISLYVGLAVILSIAISLFWLVVLVAAHFALEWHKHSIKVQGAWSWVASESLWAVLLDVGLVLFALALSLYMDLVFGILGLSVAARAGAQGVARAGARFAGWQRAMRGVLLSLDDAVHVGRSFISGSKRQIEMEDDEAPKHSSWTSKWSLAEHLCFWFTMACLGLIVFAPAVAGYAPSEVYQILLDELRPFP